MTTFEEIYTKFFSKIQKDKSFFLSNMMYPEDAYEQAIVNSKDYMDEAIVEIVIQGNLDAPIDLIGAKNDMLEQFNEQLNLIEIDLITDIMVEKHLERTVVERLNYLQTRYHSNDLKVFSPADSVRTFNASLEKLKSTNIRNIRLYKKRNRENFKYNKFDYSIFGS